MATVLMLRRLGLALLGTSLRATGPLSVQMHATSSHGRRRRGQSSKPPEDEEFDGEEDDEGPDVEEIANALKRQKKAILLKKLKQEMEPRMPPTRTLTWAAMEQIRQLKEEFPEEWTVTRLAKGFNVDVDIIKRVLHSKFSPSLAVKLKQDAKAMKSLGIKAISQGHKPEPQQLMGPPENLPVVRIQPEKDRQQKRIFGRATAKESLPLNALQPHSVTSSAVVKAHKNFAVENSSFTSERLLINAKDWHQGKSDSSSMVPALPTTNVSASCTSEESSRVQVQDCDEVWDRWVLSEEEMEYLAESGYKSNLKVVQKGREFFDSNGNFLYRI